MFNIEDLKIGEIQFMITKIRNDGRRVKEIRIPQESMGSSDKEERSKHSRREDREIIT